MRPRVGFLGVGWIGRSRMEAIASAGDVDVAAVCDPSEEMALAALNVAPDAQRFADLDAMLALGLDGVVIATPSALHVPQAVAALERGAAVFCQKPLGRNAAETERAVVAARRADRLLGVDMSYRHTAAAASVAALARGGDLGKVYAADLVFHNAYGPDKDWFYDPHLSGGGCLADLGVHLIDLALWMLDWPEITSVHSHLLANGAPLRQRDRVEDYAAVTLTTASGAVVRIACSWRLPAGQDAQIEASFYGTEGGAALRNVGGSFYDFEALRFVGTQRQQITAPPDSWSGRAAVDWACRLAQGARYAPEVEQALTVAEILDRSYAAIVLPAQRSTISTDWPGAEGRSSW